MTQKKIERLLDEKQEKNNVTISSFFGTLSESDDGEWARIEKKLDDARSKPSNRNTLKLD